MGKVTLKGAVLQIQELQYPGIYSLLSSDDQSHGLRCNYCFKSIGSYATQIKYYQSCQLHQMKRKRKTLRKSDISDVVFCKNDSCDNTFCSKECVRLNLFENSHWLSCYTSKENLSLAKDFAIFTENDHLLFNHNLAFKIISKIIGTSLSNSLKTAISDTESKFNQALLYNFKSLLEQYFQSFSVVVNLELSESEGHEIRESFTMLSALLLFSSPPPIDEMLQLDSKDNDNYSIEFKNSLQEMYLEVIQTPIQITSSSFSFALCSMDLWKQLLTSVRQYQIKLPLISSIITGAIELPLIEQSFYEDGKKWMLSRKGQQLLAYADYIESCYKYFGDEMPSATETSRMKMEDYSVVELERHCVRLAQTAQLIKSNSHFDNTKSPILNPFRHFVASVAVLIPCAVPFVTHTSQSSSNILTLHHSCLSNITLELCENEIPSPQYPMEKVNPMERLSIRLMAIKNISSDEELTYDYSQSITTTSMDRIHTKKIKTIEETAACNSKCFYESFVKYKENDWQISQLEPNHHPLMYNQPLSSFCRITSNRSLNLKVRHPQLLDHWSCLCSRCIYDVRQLQWAESLTSNGELIVDSVECTKGSLLNYLIQYQVLTLASKFSRQHPQHESITPCNTPYKQNNEIKTDFGWWTSLVIPLHDDMNKDILCKAMTPTGSFFLTKNVTRGLLSQILGLNSIQYPLSSHQKIKSKHPNSKYLQQFTHGNLNETLFYLYDVKSLTDVFMMEDQINEAIDLCCHTILSILKCHFIIVSNYAVNQSTGDQYLFESHSEEDDRLIQNLNYSRFVLADCFYSLGVLFLDAYMVPFTMHSSDTNQIVSVSTWPLAHQMWRLGVKLCSHGLVCDPSVSIEPIHANLFEAVKKLDFYDYNGHSGDISYDSKDIIFYDTIPLLQDNTSKIYLTTQQIISELECNEVIHAAESWAKRKNPVQDSPKLDTETVSSDVSNESNPSNLTQNSGTSSEHGWSTNRHYAFPTTDLPIHEILTDELMDDGTYCHDVQVLRWFNQLMKTRIVPMMVHQYVTSKHNSMDSTIEYHVQSKIDDPICCKDDERQGIRNVSICVHDAFIVKYDQTSINSDEFYIQDMKSKELGSTIPRKKTQKQSFLPLHMDQSTHSLTIALNSVGEYQGGGTYFTDIHTSIRPDVGQMVVFEGGNVLHGGDPTVQGTRYIIAAFILIFDTTDLLQFNQNCQSVVHLHTNHPLQQMEDSNKNFSFSFEI